MCGSKREVTGRKRREINEGLSDLDCLLNITKAIK